MVLVRLWRRLLATTLKDLKPSSVLSRWVNRELLMISKPSYAKFAICEKR